MRSEKMTKVQWHGRAGEIVTIYGARGRVLIRRTFDTKKRAGDFFRATQDLLRDQVLRDRVTVLK